ncbi:MAG: phosphatase PAP2 family protein [Lachnospiraceae bacterium]|jgi:undecaprenyl-diphosphatase|nr:phosphatase PAP2 family protein [Lachnospiraceae bacterium]MCI1328523.1 phosphatase PAP2 family protein [Lachnospiraceae bacterium]
MNWITEIDTAILLWIQNHLRTPVMTGFWRLITGFGEAGIFWIAVALVLILIPSKRKTGLTCAVSMVLVFAVTYALKFTVCRLRPYDACVQIIPLVKKLRDYSFPSGHTSFSFAAALILMRLEDRKIRIPALVLSILIALSRLYLGVHYPSDVIAGFLVALAGSAAAFRLTKKLREDKQPV